MTGEDSPSGIAPDEDRPGRALTPSPARPGRPPADAFADTGRRWLAVLRAELEDRGLPT